MLLNVQGAFFCVLRRLNTIIIDECLGHMENTDNIFLIPRPLYRLGDQNLTNRFFSMPWGTMRFGVGGLGAKRVMLACYLRTKYFRVA